MVAHKASLVVVDDGGLDWCVVLEREKHNPRPFINTVEPESDQVNFLSLVWLVLNKILGNFLQFC